MTSFVHRTHFTNGSAEMPMSAGRAIRSCSVFRKDITEVELDEIREATNKAWALGNDRFKEKIEALARRRTTPRPRGRPKKGPD